MKIEGASEGPGQGPRDLEMDRWLHIPVIRNVPDTYMSFTWRPSTYLTTVPYLGIVGISRNDVLSISGDHAKTNRGSRGRVFRNDALQDQRQAGLVPFSPSA